MLDSLCSFLTIVGAYALGCFLYDNLKSPFLLLKAFYQNNLNNSKEVQSLSKRYGKWAAITGASDGIGKAYAHELARHGLNIVLISRSEEKLKGVAQEIENQHGVQTKIIVADFTKGKAVYSHIETEIQNTPVGILVNNVGTTTSKPAPMASCTSDELCTILETNIFPVTLLSRFFMLHMNKAGIKGIIINISSGLELMPIPFYAALYAATKSFTRSLTKSLQYEAQSLGIEVQLVSPSFVVTKINSYSAWVMKGGFFIPSAEKYARWAVSTIGVVSETSGYYSHGLNYFLVKILPVAARTWISVVVGNLLINDS